MMMIGGFDTLTDMLIFVIWIFYTMVFVGVILLRKKEPDLFRPYKVPMYPFIPLVAIIGGTFIVSDAYHSDLFSFDGDSIDTCWYPDLSLFKT